LTGVLGEMWYARDCVVEHRYDSSDQLKRWDLGGHSLSEVRLHVGVTHLALPYIGARRRSELLEITESDDMSPWRLGTNYDRPIARRFAEEAGVPRDFFGQKKMATIVAMARPPFPFDPKLKQEYESYLLQNRLLTSWQLPLTPVVLWFNNLVYRYKPQQYFVDSLSEVKSDRHRWRYRIGYALNRVAKTILRRPLKPTQLWTHLYATLYCFAVNEVANRIYRKAIVPLPPETLHCERENRPDLATADNKVNVNVT
jgi:hypothetical protein